MNVTLNLPGWSPRDHSFSLSMQSHCYFWFLGVPSGQITWLTQAWLSNNHTFSSRSRDTCSSSERNSWGRGPFHLPIAAVPQPTCLGVRRLHSAPSICTSVWQSIVEAWGARGCTGLGDGSHIRSLIDVASQDVVMWLTHTSSYYWT